MSYNSTYLIKDRKRYELASFRGVDASSTPTEVSPTRSTYMRNVINRDGLNRKRYGWEQDLSYSPQSGTIYGKFDLKTKNGVIHLVHQNNKLLVKSELGYLDITNTKFYINENGYPELITDSCVLDDYKITELEQKKSQMFESNNRGYFVGIGNYAVLGTWGVDINNNNIYELRKVYNNEDTYTPLVTINIDDDSNSSTDVRSSLDDYNLMTSRVRYGLVGRTIPNSGLTYSLGKQIDIKHFNIEVHTYLTSNAQKTEWEKIVNYGIPPESEPTTQFIGVSTEYTYLYSGNKATFTNGSSEKKPVSFRLYARTNSVSISYYNSKCKGNAVGATFSNGYYTKWLQITNGSTDLGCFYCLYDNNHTIQRRLAFASPSLDAFLRHTITTRGQVEVGGLTYSINDMFSFETTGMEATDSDITCSSLNLNVNILRSFAIQGKFPIYNEGYSFYEKTDDGFGDTSIGVVQTAQGKISFMYIESRENDLLPKIEASTNIYVTNNEETKTEQFTFASIDQCDFGVIFGADGSCDRLFLTGNENSNIIFWSEFTDNSYCSNGSGYEYTPFTYISDLAYISLGTSKSNVTGMFAMNDSTLAVFKENKQNENNFYALSATSSSIETITVNGVDYSLPVLKVTSASANMPQTAINNKCFGSLASDILFASKNGVYAINVSDSVNIQRYAIERSETINNIFKDLDMQNAKAIVYDNKYFLSAKYKKNETDSEGNSLEEDLILIADARYRYTLDRNMDDSYNYEWYIWNNCKVEEFFIDDDNNLCFYDTDSRYCIFMKNSFEDITKTAGSTGSITVDRYGNFVFDDSLFGEGKVLEDSNDSILLTNCSFTTCGETITIESPSTKRFYYAPYTDSNGVNHPQNFKLSEDDSNDDSFTISLTSDSVPTFLHRSKVNAIWFTPVMDLGASDKLKTLFAVTLGVDNKTKGDVIVGYKTKYDSMDITSNITQGCGDFDFSSLDFTNLSFGSQFASSSTTKIKVRAFTYIQFIFASNSTKDFAVNNLTLSYKYNTNNKGVY